MEPIISTLFGKVTELAVDNALLRKDVDALQNAVQTLLQEHNQQLANQSQQERQTIAHIRQDNVIKDNRIKELEEALEKTKK